MAEISDSVQRAIEELTNGELIGFPTETVYGLAGNALRESSILKIFETKNRPAFDPLIVHAFSVEEVKKFVREIPKKLSLLMEVFSPGPMTFLLPKRNNIPDLVTSGLDNVAVRIPNHPVALKLLSSLPFPLAAPSANPFGYVSPTNSKHVNDQLGNRINFILEGGDCAIGLESTIVGMEDDKVTIYRLGGISVEDIVNVVGEVKIKSHSSSNPAAPGMLKSHYAPSKKLVLSTDFQKIKKGFQHIGYIGFDTLNSEIPEQNQLLLSVNGNLNEAAKNLFSVLRATEHRDEEIFIVGLVPETGLGKAINDRLRRATSNS
jgi:L-threonylcarbamoyladenylate synthase